MGQARSPRREKYWSRLKTPVQRLWAEGLHMSINCSVHKVVTKHWVLDEPRHWITLDKRVIWDTGSFLRSASAPGRGRRTETFEEIYWGPHGASVVANLLRQYLDRPRERLFEPFEADEWELTDVLRAADWRLGKAALLHWAEALDAQHPARAVIAARFDPASHHQHGAK